MPKYTCKKCGTECYGCILYGLNSCHSCGALIHRRDVQESWMRPLELAHLAHSCLPEGLEKAKLLLFER